MCKLWENPSDIIYLKEKSEKFAKKLDRLNKIRLKLLHERGFYSGRNRRLNRTR
jgi:hypothetical protein